MRSYLQWLDEEGFVVPATWDYEKQVWGGPGFLVLTDFQRRLMEHVWTPDDRGVLPYNTVVFGQTKKSGKTASGASVMAWAAEEWGPLTEVYSTASAQKQVIGRAFSDLLFHMERSPHLIGYKAVDDTITFPNKSKIVALAKNWKSAEGSRHSLTHWDELHTFSTEADTKMWEALTPIPTVLNSVRLVTTYAGVEGEADLLWDIYLAGVGKDEHPDGKGERIPGMEDLPVWRNGRQFTLWDHENRMPWQTPEYLAAQRKDLRPGTYLRYHANRWSASEEAFIPKEWYAHAQSYYPQSAWEWKEHPYHNYPVIVAIDAATTKDTIAIVGVTYDAAAGCIVLLFHRIWETKNEPRFDFEETVEGYLMEAARRFQVLSFYYDPKDFHQTSVRLAKKGLNMVQYTQTAANTAAYSQALYELLKGKNLRAYPDEEAERQIMLTVAEVKGGAFRIAKKKTRADTPNDFTVALAMACKKALESGGVDNETILRVESPFADASAWKPDSGEPGYIPFELRG